MIGGRTALAWMRLANSIWYHEILGLSVAIRNFVTLAKMDIKDNLPIDAVEQRFEEIDRIALQILNKKEMLPTGVATDVELHNIKHLLEDLLRRIEREKAGSGVSSSVG